MFADAKTAVELGYWGLFLGLFAFRFYPTPYRPILYYLTLIGSTMPLALVIYRDVWPRFLSDPPPNMADDARSGWGVNARLFLSVVVEIGFFCTPRKW